MRTKDILLMSFLMTIPAAAAGQASQGDEWLRNPVDDATYAGFLQFFSYDRQVPFQAEIGPVVTEAGVSRQHLEYQSTPGVRVTAWIYRAAVGPTAPWVLFLHGGGGSGKDAPTYHATCSFLTRAGWNVLAIDLQYFGERNTELLTAFTETEKHERLYNQQATYLAWVSQTMKDVGRGIDFILQEEGADPDRIVLMGHSRGAQLAFIAGAVDKRFRAVVASYGGHFDAMEVGHLSAACPANYIGRISPRPLLMINGTQDRDFFKEVSVDPMHALAREPVDAIWLQTGHTIPPEDTFSEIVRWMAEKVR